jgi:hypothetical protein
MLIAAKIVRVAAGPADCSPLRATGPRDTQAITITEYRTHTVGQNHRMTANDVCKPDGIFFSKKAPPKRGCQVGGMPSQRGLIR